MSKQIFRIDQFLYTREFKKFEKALKGLNEVADKTSMEVLKQQAKLFCVDLVYVTQPWGKGSKAKKLGMNAVRRDISYVYLDESSTYKEIEKQSINLAKKFYYLVKKGNYSEAKEIADKLNISALIFDAGQRHKSSRNSRGRVPHINKNKGFTYPRDEVERYSKEVQKRVGFAKSSWYHAALDINSTTLIKLPAWIKNHKKKTGRAYLKRRKGINEIILESTVSYMNNILKRYHILRAMNSRARSIERLIKRIIEAKSKTL